ncbi:hypothetical protein niasHS_009043 [Heterodera schachtii]|uniref:Uncharacterized protein n=1 Tax=Heterodera schachtii TaxID=97005 RepID=A0ABD2J344_HETSC
MKKVVIQQIDDAEKIVNENEHKGLENFCNALEERIGIIMNVLNNEWSGVPKLVDVAFPEREILQRFYPHQLESDLDVNSKAGSLSLGVVCPHPTPICYCHWPQGNVHYSGRI